MRSRIAGRAENRPKPKLWMLTVALGLLVLAGCGSSSTTSSSTSAPASTPATTSSATSSTPAPATSGSAGHTLALAANPEGNLKFDTSSLSAKAGKVTIAFANQASLEHNLTVESPSGSVLGATPTFAGGTKALTLTLAAGTYKFYCSVPGHRQAGMEGTLVVK